MAQIDKSLAVRRLQKYGSIIGGIHWGMENEILKVEVSGAEGCIHPHDKDGSTKIELIIPPGSMPGDVIIVKATPVPKRDP
ncbi:hypothetical protein LCGC14_2134400 [marine sediment metagenome]|uniref:Uncharacterized protein n=1 Tax=marine sediment metagenome TaxID=412755 RepID=A0A0F9E0H7_9ZZZZ